MQFVRKETRKKVIKLEDGKDGSLYPNNLQFYSLPPTENITLQDFEEFAVHRLKGWSLVFSPGAEFNKSFTSRNFKARKFTGAKASPSKLRILV